MKPLVSKKNRQSYETILLEAIDDALETLGENVKVSIYFHLQTKFNLPKEEIPNRVTDFSDALERIFGVGSKKIEILVMKFLNDKIQVNYEWTGPSWLVPNLTFEGYVEMVKATAKSNETAEKLPCKEGEALG